jgi:hypothetical protein
MIPHSLSATTIEELRQFPFQEWIQANAKEYLSQDKAVCHYVTDATGLLVQVMFVPEYQEGGFTVPASPTLFLKMMQKVTGIYPQQLLSLMSICMMDQPKAAHMRKEYGIARMAISMEDAAYLLLYRWYVLQQTTVAEMEKSKNYS